MLTVLTVLSVCLARWKSKRKASTHHPTPGPSHTQDMELTQEEAYNTIRNIPLNFNESYGTTTTLMDSDELYATPMVGQRYIVAHNLNEEDNYYVIPHL